MDAQGTVRRRLFGARPGARADARRWLRGLAAAFGGLVLLLGAAGGGLFLALSRGPIDAPFVGRAVEAELERSLGKGWDVTHAAARIERGEHGPAIVIDDLGIRNRKGELVAAAPKAQVTIDVWPLFLAQVKPRRLELSETALRLERLEDGSLAFAAGDEAPLATSGPRPAAADAAGPRPLSETIAEAARLLHDLAADPDAPGASLERLAVTRGRLSVIDRVNGRTTEFRGVDLAFERAGPRGATLYLSAQGPSGRWTALARAVGAAAGKRRVEAEIRDLSLDEVALLAGFRERPVDFDTPISLRADVALGADGAMKAAGGRFALGAGFFRIDDPDHEPFLVDEVVGGFRWDPATGDILVEPTQLSAGETRLSIGGRIVPPPRPGEDWTVELASADNVLAGERPQEKTLTLGRLALRARYGAHDARLSIDKLQLSGGDADVAISGEVLGGDAGPALRLSLEASRMAARSFLRLWPSLIAAETRAWFLRALKSGALAKGALKLDIGAEDFRRLKAQQPPSAGAVELSFAIEDATLDYLDGAPPLTAVAGEGRVDGVSALFEARRAEVQLAARRLTIPEARFAVPDFAIKPTPARLDLRLRGPLDGALELLGKPAFREHADVPAQARNAKGEIDAKIEVSLRLGSSKPGDVQTRLTATATGVTLEQVLGDQKFENATLAVTADAGGLTARGEGRLLGAPAQIEMKKPAGKAGEAQIVATLDDAQRNRHGFAAAGLTGPVTARFSAPLGGEGKGGRPKRAQVDIDFTRAGFADLAGVLSKPAGKPAKASFTLIDGDNALTLDNLAFDGAGVMARGDVRLTGDGKFVSAKLSNVKLSPGDDLRVEATKSGETLKLVARGQAVDARPFLKGLAGGGGKDKGADFDLDLKATLLTGHNKQAIANAEVKLARAGGRLKALHVAGRFGRDPVEATLGADGRSVALESADAGAALAFLDLYKRMEGGRLTGGARFESDHVEAAITVKDFILRDEPAMRRLVDQTAAQRGESASGKVDPRNVPFSRLHVRLARAGDRLTIHEGVLSGASIGMTTEGTIDLRSERLQLTGAFVPAYGINNFFAKIPLFGPILGGGSNEGLFAVNYRLTGTIAAPSVSVNPLSALAPGFLRHVFGAVGGDGRPAPELADDGARGSGRSPAAATNRPSAPARPLELSPGR